MYYAIVKKSGEFGKWYHINTDTLEKAQEFISTSIYVKNSKKTLKDYIIKTDDEYNKMVLKNKKDAEDKLEENLKLDPIAINVLEKILETEYKDVTIETIEDYSLKTDTHKPYYVTCYWENDGNGSFCDLEDIEGMYHDKATLGYYDNYEMTIYDAKTCNELDVTVSVTVKIGIDVKTNRK
jgi:hypothetical protein